MNRPHLGGFSYLEKLSIIVGVHVVSDDDDDFMKLLQRHIFLEVHSSSASLPDKSILCVSVYVGGLNVQTLLSHMH